MDLAERLDKFHRTVRGYTVFGLVELALAGFAIWFGAIKNRPLAYVLAVILLAVFVQNAIGLIERVRNGKQAD